MVCPPGRAWGADTGIVVSVVSDRSPGPAARHGLKKVTAALEARGVAAQRASLPYSTKSDMLIVAGLASGDGAAARMLRDRRIEAPTAAEALLIRRVTVGDKPALLVVGSDDRGLMYGLLDVADRIGWGENASRPLSEVKDTAEKPYVVERALSMYAMHPEVFQRRFRSQEHWERYLDMLAENRFNTFVLILGYSPATYFTPPYPFFFDVEGFPEVRVQRLSRKAQQRNLAMLERVIRMTHDRGMNFTLGIWDHVSRSGKGAGYRRPSGLTRENLAPYTVAALPRLLELVPEIDAIQFRMHWESGLTREETPGFWIDVLRAIAQTGTKTRIDARAKGLPDEVIAMAVDSGLDFRITTKYWAEQMGLPFHPTHINRGNQFDRRHSYADLLAYPKKYPMHWKMWNAGTNKILLWADPEYARRFAGSTHLYDGQGFEVNEPNATKMAFQPQAPPFELLNPKYKFYDWEFERYWHFFQVFGRLGYNPDTPPEVWHRQFERRFGEAGPYVERGLHRASGVLPRIIGYAMRSFPSLSSFWDNHTGGDIDRYVDVKPSDIQQFLSIQEEAQLLLNSGDSPKIRPTQTAAWFAQAADDIFAQVAQAEKHVGENKTNEYLSTVTDLRILANLARYHSIRPHAGVNYALFKQTGDLHALDDAIRHEGRAVKAWQALVEAAGDFYPDRIKMDRGTSGHWRNELPKLKAGLEKLRNTRKDFEPSAEEGPRLVHVPIRKIAPGGELIVRATIAGLRSEVAARIAYRHGDGRYRHVDMRQTERYLYRGAIPGAEVCDGMSYHIEADGVPKTAAVTVTVTGDNEPPAVAHVPVTTARPRQPLTVEAKVRDSSGVKWVRLRYRGVTQFQDFKTLEMQPTATPGEYRAVVPAEALDPKWDFMYLIEVMDNKGNGKIYPDLECETPYVVVTLQR
jgi:hypothetical protein